MSTTRRESGFSFVEALIALAILLGAMAVAFMFFVDFGEAINTESSTLASQQAGRVVVDELTRHVRQVGFGILRADEYNASTWQQAVIHAGSHVLAFNADIDDEIGGIPATQSISFPTGAAYVGEAIGATQNGAETYVYTIDADGNNAIELADRTDALSGSYNPAADTANPMDFALFRRIYGFNGTDYGGAMVPLAPHLFTNGTADITYPEDGTSPDPLFTYWLTEDLNRDGTLSPSECVNDVVDTCPPVTTRAPMLYLWGDTDFDGTLSESEKTALRAMEVGSTAWSKNVFASGGAYKSTTLAVAVDPGALDAFELKIANGAVLGPGYHIQVGTGSDAETFLVDQVSTASTPHTALLSTKPEKIHGTGAIVRVLPSTMLRAIRTIGIAYTSITDRKDSSNGEAAAGRSGRVGTGGLDFRVAAYHRNVEVINAPTAASVNDASNISSTICPLQIVNFCSMSATEQATIYTSPVQAQNLKFLVTDLMGNPIPDVTVMFDNSAGWIGSLSQGEALTDSNGLATVGYTPSGVLGTDLIEATVHCIGTGEVVIEDAATNTIDTHEISATVSTDCLSTVSSRTPAPSTDFTVQVLMETGVVTAQDILFDLEFVGEYLPEAPDFTSLVGELTLGGTSAGMTSGEGKLLDVATTTDSNGQVLGSVGLVSDFAGKGAGFKLSARAPADLCSGIEGRADTWVKFFLLGLDSTVPNPGCTEFLPCTIGESSPAPKVTAELTINDTPIQNATLLFTNTDINPPTDGTDTGASLLLPGPENSTDASGNATVIVANNGSPLITPETPLLTHVDVTGTGIPTLCGNTAIASSSNKAGFLFEAPTNLCGASLQQSFVVRDGNDKICLNILNDADAEGCPMAVQGIGITIYQADGVTPDISDGSIVKKMEGGGVGGSASCSNSDSVRLFEDKCRIPKDLLPNGEPWMFRNYDSCSEPYLFVNPLQFFPIHEIQFDDNYPAGRDMDVTVYYECQGDCATGSTDSATFRLTTP